jgi:hypothetical protein
MFATRMRTGAAELVSNGSASRPYIPSPDAPPSSVDCNIGGLVSTLSLSAKQISRPSLIWAKRMGNNLDKASHLRCALKDNGPFASCPTPALLLPCSRRATDNLDDHKWTHLPAFIGLVLCISMYCYFNSHISLMKNSGRSHSKFQKEYSVHIRWIHRQDTFFIVSRLCYD